MFQFSFSQPETDESNLFSKKSTNVSTENDLDVNKSLAGRKEPCKEIQPNVDKLLFKDPTQFGIENPTEELLLENGMLIEYVEVDDDIDDYISSDNQNSDLPENSDLIPGIYEGGAKIWECTIDLANYLLRNTKSLETKTILDLGCGAGILGIVALNLGAAVHFHDYNEKVIEKVTIENIKLNHKNDDLANVLKRCKFYCGDWQEYVDSTDSNMLFDLILTSETIYNTSNYKSLIDVLKTKLKPNGITYLAAKTYYFGVGGSVCDFEQRIEQDGNLHTETVWCDRENVKREILKITKNNLTEMIDKENITK